MLIRRARPEDAEAIMSVIDAGWIWAYGHIIPPEDMAIRHNPERVERFLTWLRGDQVTWVAEEAGKVIGMASVEEPCRLESADYEVGGLYVHPDSARKGTGRALLAEACAHGIALGRTKLAIHTLKDNVIGRSFYERLGGRLAHEDFWSFCDKPYRAVWYLWDDLIDLLAECRIAPADPKAGG